MPKRSNNRSWGPHGGRPVQPGDKHYYGHDDRVVRVNDGSYGGTRPRVSFKAHNRNNRQIPRPGMLSSLDEDIPMTGVSNNNVRQVIVRGRGRGISRGRNSPLPNKGFKRGPSTASRSRPVQLGESSWYRINIPYGHKYEKDYILKTLLSFTAPGIFVPMMYKTMGNDASFYVDDYKTASALQQCDRKITLKDGFKLQVRVKPGFPQCEIDEKLKERLKQAMSKRYVPETNALDLSKFHLDTDLVDDYFCALFRPAMLMTVLDIVAEHIPNLEALNLEGNKLHIIERLSVLHKKFPQLKILYIGDNKIREMNQLEVIKDLKLEELRLAGNPVCNKYKSRQSDYVNDVRKHFPKLLKLDGAELPRPIVFDVVDEENRIPPPQRLFVADAKAQEIASQFLQQYFLIFDSENRQPLLDAYNENTCFSMTTSYFHSNRSGYLMENRNLFRINDTAKRHKLLKQGKLPVVSFISEMPRTKHFLDTFTMDITLVTQSMMFVTITGYFKEDTKEQPIRYFNRTFIIVPEGNGYSIRNEQLHISQPSDIQLKQLKKRLEGGRVEPLEPPAAEEPKVSVEPVVSPVKAAPVELSEDIKQQMTLTLSQQTNMNLAWSLKCLEEVQWNYNNALSAFQEFFNRGQIPSEAFAK